MGYRSCKRGHVVDKRNRLPDGACRACSNIVKAKWKREHPESNRATFKKWRLKNLEKCAADRARWGRNNREAVAIYSKKWCEENRESRATNERNRRARKLGASGEASLVQVRARIAFHKFRCVYCGKPYEHVDHAKSLARGGSNWPSNLVPACASCNLRKQTKSWKEFRAKNV